MITAGLYRNPFGVELRIFPEPEEKNDLLMSELAQFDVIALEEKATALYDVLLGQGWLDLGS